MPSSRPDRVRGTTIAAVSPAGSTFVTPAAAGTWQVVVRVSSPMAWNVYCPAGRWAGIVRVFGF
ncbi:MAG: hypothetical protein ACYDAN_09105 [Candidatus Limnocylindrales bacterium]